MLLGFLVAALAMAVWRLNGMAGTAFLPAILLAGLPIFDMTMVIVSRLRRGAPIYKGGRDHTTHRLLPMIGSTWGVALALGLAQGALSLVAISLMDASKTAMLVGAGVAFLLGVATIALLESAPFQPGSASALAEDKPAPAPLQHQPSIAPSSQSWERASMSTPRRDGATSGRSMPRTGPEP
jgi:UDP-GlcNAc:undecaprenyl-phosphate/decaprenyl-phosphate GlcNAc-1-phosphate transferase